LIRDQWSLFAGWPLQSPLKRGDAPHNPASHNCVGLAVLVQFERGTRICA